MSVSRSTPVAEVVQQCVPAWDAFVNDMLKSVRHEVKREARRGGQRTCMGLMDIHSKDQVWLGSPDGRGGLSRKDYTVDQVEKGLAELGCPHHEVSELTIATPRGLGEFKHYTAVVAWGPIGNAHLPGNGQAQRDGRVRNTFESATSSLRGRGHIGRRRPSSAPAVRRDTSAQHEIIRGLGEYDDYLNSRMSQLETMHMVPRTSPKQSNEYIRDAGHDQHAQEKRPASAPHEHHNAAKLREDISTQATVGRIQSAAVTEAQADTVHDKAPGQRYSSPKMKRAASAPYHSAVRAVAGRRRPGRPSQSATPSRRGAAPAAKDRVDEFMTKSTQARMSRTRPINTHFENQKSFEASLRGSLEGAGRGQQGKLRKSNVAASGLKMQHKMAHGLSNASTSASTLSCVGQGLGPR